VIELLFNLTPKRKLLGCTNFLFGVLLYITAFLKTTIAAVASGNLYHWIDLCRYGEKMEGIFA